MSEKKSYPFEEDMKEKADWFFKTRGKKTEQELSKQWHNALKHLDKLKKLRVKGLDPGKAGLKKITVGKLDDPKAKIQTIKNPKAGDSKHFIGECIRIKSDRKFISGSIQIPVTSTILSKSKLNPETIRVFYWDPQQRHWELVQNSGFNKKDNYAWAYVFREGIYAMIGLPDQKEKVREIALTRFATIHMQVGMESQIISKANEFFETKAFDEIAELSIESKSKKTQEELKNIFDETLKLKRIWPSQFPNNGMPEWQILDDYREYKPKYLIDFNINDIITTYLPSFYLNNKVGRWYPFGPTNINGRVKSLAIHPTNGDILFAGAANGGVWRSKNGGDTWSSKWKFEDSLAIGSIAVAPSNGNIIYAATGEDTPYYGPSYGGAGIYKSVNGGDSWIQMEPAASVGNRCTKIVVHPTNPNTVYLASDTGIHKSTDGGDTWTLKKAGHATDLVIAHDAPNILYAGLWNDGIYKTTTSGNSWSRIQGGILKIKILFTTITFPFPTGNAADWIKLSIGKSGTNGSSFLVAKMGNDGATAYRTNNGGAEWGFMATPPGASYNEWCNMIAVHPSDHNSVYAGAVGMSYSENGYSWTPASGTHSDHHQMVFHPANANTCFVACDGGVYKSTNKGKNWSLKSNYLTATQLVSLGVSDKGNFLIGGATQDQGIIQSEGNFDWDDFGGGNEWGFFVVDPNDPSNIYVSPGGGNLRKSTNRGRNYSNPTTGLTDWWAAQNKNTPPAVFRHIAVQPGNSNILIAACTVKDEVKDADGNVTATYPTKQRIYYSSDRANSWNIAKNLTVEASRVAYSKSNPNRAYAATSDGRVFRSNDGGQSGWTEPYTPANKPHNGYITSIYVDQWDQNVVYITFGNASPHAMRSTDGGATWAGIDGTATGMTLPNISVSNILVDEENSNILYVGTDIGVFRSNDVGNSWYYYNDSLGESDLPRVPVTGMGVHFATNKLYAATLGRGVYYTYVTGYRRLRIIGIRHFLAGKMRPGIEFVKVTNNSEVWVMSRQEVINRIQAGSGFYTLGADGIKAEVVVMQPDNQHPREYIKTTPDSRKPNNLLSLPEFY